MSGPFCETCRYFQEVFGGGGECTDPTKIIYDSGGNASNDSPQVGSRSECSNHTRPNAEMGGQAAKDCAPDSFVESEEQSCS
jgi:hypothetical protein